MNGKKPENQAQFWDTVYRKPEKELSWYEPVPMTSLSLIDNAHLPKEAPIIDIGGGEGTLARHLLVLGYENITVLDISARALEIGQKRLGDMASGITWIHANVLQFEPTRSYALWHDRATFHYLVNVEEQQKYLRKTGQALQPGSHFILGTYSEKGPARCSGLPVQRYTESSMTDLLQGVFRREKQLIRQHITPLHKLQEFIYGKFTRL